MPSSFDLSLAADWARSFDEFKETVIRRLRGDSEKTEEVSAIVELDGASASGGLIEDDNGRMIQADGLLEISATQETTPDDTWVINGRVFKTVGGPVSEDGGSKTLSIVYRDKIRDRKPRVRG